MVTPLLVIYIVIALSLILIGGVVMLKNGRIVLNRLFFFFVLFLAFWLVSNFFSNFESLSQDGILVANHLVLFFSGLAVFYLMRFVSEITHNNFLRKYEKVITIASYVSVMLTLTPFVVSGVERQGDVYAINFGDLAIIYFIMLGFNAISALIALIVGATKSKGQEKNKITAILWSLSLTVLIILITNAALPLLTGSFALTNLGPLASLALVAGLSYSIVKHRLFDIRLIVARSLGYVFSILSLGALYGIFAVVVVNNFILPNQQLNISQQIVYAAIAALMAFTFQPLKSFFSKITNSLFYRDAYDPQAFIDELNKVLVNTVDIQPLLEKSAQLIESNLKADYCLFAVKETSYTDRRIIGSGTRTFDEDDIRVVRGITPHIKRRVIVAEDLNDDQSELSAKLRKYDIAVLARLVTTLEYEVEGAGYLLLGPKKSGNPYNKQDIKIIKIIANELVIAIQNALRFEEIEKFNITLQEKVDTATKKLQKTNEELKKMDETKDEFISMASHQLRTPLTSVKGYLSMVLEGDVGEITEMQKKLLDQAFISSQRMVYLIADLLNVSRLRTGKFVIEQIESNLAEVVEGEINQLQQTATGRNLQLVYKKPDNFPVLYLDETKIRQVVMNFTDNAIYYTPSGGKIEVKLEDKGDTIELTVNDNGMGVPKSEQPSLFSKFYRAGNARKARPDGTGLGLFMAKKVIIAQGGHVIFHSKQGEGSTFGFSFPKSKLQPPHKAPEPATVLVEKSDKNDDEDAGSAGKGISLAEASVGSNE